MQQVHAGSVMEGWIEGGVCTVMQCDVRTCARQNTAARTST